HPKDTLIGGTVEGPIEVHARAPTTNHPSESVQSTTRNRFGPEKWHHRKLTRWSSLDVQIPILMPPWQLPFQSSGVVRLDAVRSDSATFQSRKSARSAVDFPQRPTFQPQLFLLPKKGAVEPTCRGKPPEQG